VVVPGYPLPGGEKGARFAIFAIPYDMNSADARLMAFDASENQAERSFIDQFFPKEFKQDAVELSEAFLNKVVPEIMSQTPELQDRGTCSITISRSTGICARKTLRRSWNLPKSRAGNALEQAVCRHTKRQSDGGLCRLPHLPAPGECRGPPDAPRL